MKNTTPIKSREIVIKITVDPTKAAKGHQAHRSGGGQHHDRRTARNRTRSQQNRNALSGW